jgi:hypothetical protein
MNLSEWAVNYVKHKDLVARNLKGFVVKDGFVEFSFNDKVHDYFIMDLLNISKIKEIMNNQSGHLKTIVCMHNQDNFNTIVSNWDELIKQSITLIFVNPQHEDRWIINPQLHNRIADKAKLKQGLKTMYDAAMGKIVMELL